MQYKISIDNDLKIIRYKHTGELGFGDIGLAWEELLLLKEFTVGKYNLFSDYRNAVFKLKIDEIKDIIDFLKGVEPIVRGKKQSLLVHDPYATAGSILFQEDVYKEVGFIVNVFSTEDKALKWLVKPVG